MGWYLSWGLSGKESTFFRADKENSSQETGRGRGTLAGLCLVCIKKIKESETGA